MSGRWRRGLVKPSITDRMTTGAPGCDPDALVGKRVRAVWEIPDSDRGEVLLETDDGKVFLLSTDPCDNEDGTGRDLTRWEVVVYDATDTEAGEAVRTWRSA